MIEQNDFAHVTPGTEDITLISASSPSMPFYCRLCGISYCDGEYLISRKKSNIYCVEYIISGTGTVKTKGKTYYPKKGDVYILMKDADHLYYSDKQDPWTKIWFNISGVLADKLMNIYNSAGETLFENTDVYEYFAEFIETAKNRSLTAEEIMSECSLVFHKILIKLQKIKPKTESEIIRDYIDTHICEPLTIETLAKVIYRSRSQTIRIFQKAFATTPYKYILNAKIETAQTFLVGTNLPIKEIAFKLSFADEHYFSNIFKKRVGISPKEYRNKFHANRPV